MKTLVECHNYGCTYNKMAECKASFVRMDEHGLCTTDTQKIDEVFK